MTRSCPIISTPSLFLPLTCCRPLDYCFFCVLASFSWFLSLYHSLLCSSLSQQHVCREFRRMHLVTQMSHTSSGLHASPSGWMNEGVVRLAGGRFQWLKGHGLCQLLNRIKNVSVCWSQGLGAYRHQLEMWLSLGGCMTDSFEQAESPPSTLTPKDSHSAKVLGPWEESPGLRLWRRTRLHLQCEKSVSALLKEIYMVGWNGLQRSLHAVRLKCSSGGVIAI